MYTLERNIIWLSLILVLAGGTAFATDYIYVDGGSVAVDPCGLSWDDAYKYLDNALDDSPPEGTHIWVAAGTYESDNATYSFQLVDGVDVYGGFAGNEDPDDPNFVLADRNILANQTILTGKKRGSATENTVVVGAITHSNAPILNGFTIKSATYGLYCNGSDLTVRNCDVFDTTNGIWCNNSDATVEDCNFVGNVQDGIHGNNASNITVSGCFISGNGQYGIELGAASTIKNSLIRYNDLGGIIGPSEGMKITNNIIFGNTGSGVHLLNPDGKGEVRNNTIVYNSDYGIKNTNSGGISPEIRNCIIWGNAVGQTSGNCSDIMFSCVQDGTTDSNNINVDPDFDLTNPNGFHLSADSPCIDAGVTDPNSYIEGELDIDGEARVYNGRIDIGADEYVSYVHVPVVDKSTDINGDGIVDHQDFALLAAAWQSLQGEGTWNADCDINNDSVVNVSDLQEVATDWLDITGDLDGDGFVNYVDFGMFSIAWSSQDGDPNYNTDYDFNGDGYIDLTDLLFLLKENGWL